MTRSELIAQLASSNPHLRQGDVEAGGWRFNKKINKRQRTRNEERPGHVSVFKHSGASNGFEQDDKRGQHGATFALIMTNVPGQDGMRFSTKNIDQ